MLVGIDLGTTNTRMEYIDLDRSLRSHDVKPVLVGGRDRFIPYMKILSSDL